MQRKKTKNQSYKQSILNRVKKIWLDLERLQLLVTKWLDSKRRPNPRRFQQTQPNRPLQLRPCKNQNRLLEIKIGKDLAVKVRKTTGFWGLEKWNWKIGQVCKDLLSDRQLSASWLKWMKFWRLSCQGKLRMEQAQQNSEMEGIMQVRLVLAKSSNCPQLLDRDILT